MEGKQRHMGLHEHPLPFVRGELEREFQGGRVGKDKKETASAPLI